MAYKISTKRSVRFRYKHYPVLIHLIQYKIFTIRHSHLKSSIPVFFNDTKRIIMRIFYYSAATLHSCSLSARL